MQATLKPLVLLTTLPQESHGLGLLMVEAMMSVAGTGCLSLGVQTPPADIVKAVRAQGADIVALSFSSTQLPRAVAAGLRDLRALLPAGVQIWAGGVGLARVPRLPEGVKVMLDLDDIEPALTEWRKMTVLRLSSY
ncbi:MAG: cobalamin B12-binding domain-containing protein [Candidatus Protistobacter heckmanni]|nr:cobalamin B12-binding domain-containing protein [Candidatus Protistobacter heckmanni]